MQSSRLMFFLFLIYVQYIPYIEVIQICHQDADVGGRYNILFSTVAKSKETKKQDD